MSNIIYNQKEIYDDWLNNLAGYDNFILAGGSDARSYEVLRRMNERGVTLGRIIFFDFLERKDVDSAQIEVYESITDFGYEIIKLDCTIFDPKVGLSKLYNVISKEELQRSSIAMDITAFPKPYFFSVLNSFDKYIKRSSIDVFYTEPISYVFSRKNFSSYNSSSGPVTVEVVPSFIGLDKQNIKRVLVIILGFDGDLAERVNIEVDPNDTILFNGFPSFSPKFKDISIIVNESLISSRSSLRYSEANNPFLLYNELEVIKNEYKGENVELNIVPLGAKPMALGACMFAIHNSDVRVIYPIPEKYHNHTSNSSLKSWFYEMPLTTSIIQT